MATINIGGRTVDVPDDLDPARPAGPTLRGGGSPAPQATPRPTAAFDAEVAQRAQQLRQARTAATSAGPDVPTAPAAASAQVQPPGTLRNAYNTAVGRDVVTGPPHPGKLRGLIDKGMGGGNSAAILGGGVAAVQEYPKLAGVATEKGFTSPEFATQAAEGVAKIAGRGAGTAIGAKLGGAGGAALGALGGPLAPLTVPVGGVLGAAAGGFIGDWLANNGIDVAIKGGRNALGVDPRSPAEQVNAASAAPVATPAAPASVKDPYAGANAAKLAAGGTNAPAPVANPGAVTRNGSSYEGTNVRGDITINGFPPGAGLGRTGPSAQNMAAADALAARDGLRGAAAGGAPQPITPVMSTDHSGNSWSARNHLRNLETSASSIMNNGGRWDAHKGASPAAQAYLDAAKADTALRAGNDPMALASLKARADEANNMRSTDASRYNADQALRGNMYQIDGQLLAKRQESMLRQQQQAMVGALWQASGGKADKFQQMAMAYGLPDAAKMGGDMAAAEQTRLFNATKNAQSRLESLAVDPKTGEISKGRLAQVRAAANSAAPGFEGMDELDQNENWQNVMSAVGVIDGLNKTRDNGWLDFLSPDSPALTQLPVLRGGAISRVTPWEGATTRKVEEGDYKITMPGGRTQYLPQAGVDENTIALLKSQGATITTK